MNNLIEPDPSCCWFSSAYAPLPQHVVIKLRAPVTMEQIGVYLHGENNQNPQEVKFYVSADGESYDEVVYDTLEQRPGDFLWRVHKQHVQYVKYEVLENYGGSGAHTAQVYVLGTAE